MGVGGRSEFLPYLFIPLPLFFPFYSQEAPGPQPLPVQASLPGSLPLICSFMLLVSSLILSPRLPLPLTPS